MTGEEKGHAATALTGAAVLFVLLRLLAVSRYDLHVAFAVLHSLDLEDAPGLFLGTFLADSRISGPLLALLVPLTVFYTVNRRSTATALGAVVLLAFLVAHVLTYRGWWVPLAAVLLGGVLLLVERARRNPAAQGVVTFLLRRFGVLVLGAALLVAAVVGTPWVPLERIELVDGELRGYVVETSHGFVKVLEAEHREFRILRTDEIRSRHELAGH
ncbi:hypothetical protein [Actinosynnema mirum]|uniref:Uncharacterized protein n=1 Tax=Actinosynnema mirum (strain ATCC 29888 / DSM 43827 / JCM 3225 / NBRC 14064 / NCIMB 13271 / NRRL B-12336 / IMRU 3971 / 101) TaxID=446462 RepID=C6WQ69_ACTMD|nr:hypothetical protein [Actinosynnema mirum]ACU35125.1 hypothetical protein Amir_1171 [Actinosynnema mirum DSM 43827]